MKKFSRVFSYLGQYRGKLVLYFVCTLLATLFGVISIAMLSPFFGLIFESAQTPNPAVMRTNVLGSYISDFLEKTIADNGDNGKVAGLTAICFMIIISTILKNIFIYLSNRISVPVRAMIITKLRGDVYDKILRLPIGYFTEKRKGDIISRMTNDIGEIEGSVVGMLDGMIKDPITVIGYLVALVIISPQLSLFLLILLPVTGLLIGRVSRKLKRQSEDAAIKLGEGLSILDETLGGLRVIKAFLAEKLLSSRFHDVNDELYKIRKKMGARRDLASPLTEVFGVIVLSTILYFGGRLVLADQGIEGGELLSYIALFAMVINPAKNISNSFFNIQRGAAALVRVEEVLSAPVVVDENPNGTQLTSFNDKIEFKNVVFSYDDAVILDNVNLTIQKGKTIALVGSSGAGKSTLADLVPRFHDVTSGEVLIDGINIKDYSLYSVRSLMSIVTQEPILFNDTVANNIALGTPDATLEEIEQAAKIANAHNFISHKEAGYQTNIGDRGSKLSGGERQRLTIARAVLKNPPILILDEATSSLDTESERLVQDAINNMMQNRTSIVIAHRLSTIRHADEIIVLQKGKIVERGNHEELIAYNGFYRKLVEMQEVK
ncbi:ABC transporter ATP-binding protein/permease [Terrimonas sp. NA20]|uniref:ABC transporter ATP-binding protein/permease n=1 Tax=Terrimonas ginsenosidimutans TaxID=2908004 RepID=A0ABS9KQ14_9BACT|nr:ABC transporter ATP-binding protein [Terrimonas ginsenosidimutans]MCG2614418.1 ABC transporter ATP-binding protein/permease [Terrimonas ginsenosidimutans]